MIRAQSRRIRLLAGALALLVGLAFSAPPCLANELPLSSGSAPPVSLRAAVAAKVATLKATPSSALTQVAAPPATTKSKSFFKSTRGKVAVVLMGAGLAWVIVSRNKDAVRSPAR